MFRAEQLHYTQVVPLDKIPEYKRKTLHVQAPYLGTYYYLINTRVEPVNDVRVRKRLRTQSIRNFDSYCTPGHGDPRVQHYAPNTLGYNPPKLFDYDPEKAKALAEAGYPMGRANKVRLFTTFKGHRKIAVAVQQMWKSTLNIDVTISNQGGKFI